MQQTIISVAGLKGGVGKTVTAIHLAGFFATSVLHENKEVLLIDGDSNRSAKRWASLGKLPFKCVTERQSPKYIAHYDIIVMDMPAGMDKQDISELGEASSLVLLPTKPDGLSLAPTLDAAKLLPLETNYRILITCNPPSPSTDGEDLKLMLIDNNFDLCKTMVRSTKGFGMAAEQGILIEDLKHPSKVAQYDYNDLGLELSSFLF